MKAKLKICVLFAFYSLATPNDNLEKDCSSETRSNYKEASNGFFREINDAKMSYIPCNDRNCSCLLPVLLSDLEPFKLTGITKDMIDSVADRGTKYQVINKKLYRQKVCMFPSRCAGIEHFLLPLAKILPDIELIINCRDWPQIHNNFGVKGAVLSFSKTNEYVDIMYPTWGFWEGGPAISLYPTGIGRWDKHRNKIADAAKKWPWEDKIAKGFFRGSRTSEERDSLVLLSRMNPDLVDAQYTKNQAWKSSKDTLNADPAKEVSFEDHCQYKYLFNFRGVAASFRFKHLFLCKSLVFHVGNEWNEFFYESLKPWIHYIPVKSYPSEEDLKEAITFFQKHDTIAKEIAENGYNHIWENLKISDVECYWENLMKEYSKLIRYKVHLDQNLIEIK